MRTLTIFAAASVNFLISTVTWAVPPVRTYWVIEIPSSGYTTVGGMNNRGDVVGTAPEGAFLYDYRGQVVNYLTFGSLGTTAANDISDSGLIAGWAADPTGPVAVLWSTTGGAEALEIAGFANFASAVNNSGLVVGSFGGPGFPGGGALMWSGPQHTLTGLPALPCLHCVRFFNTAAYAVNNRGHIVGSSDYATSTTSGTHAVEWHDGAVTDLVGLSGADYSIARSINDSDDIVGLSAVGGNDTPLHAFLYRRGKMEDLGTLEGDRESSAASINDRGEIVGFSSGTDARAFIYANGQMYDLNGLIDPTSPLAGAVHLDAAVAINSRGWIAANGTRDDQTHAYLLIR